MLYQINRLLTSQSYQHWASTEFFSFGWFFTIGIVTISYFFWAKVVDKSRLGQLVLLGIFSAIGFLIAEIITIGFYGVIEYNVRLLPLFRLYLPSVLPLHRSSSCWSYSILLHGTIMFFGLRSDPHCSLSCCSPSIPSPQSCNFTIGITSLNFFCF